MSPRAASDPGEGEAALAAAAELDAPLTELPGIGPKRAQALAAAGLTTVQDLLLLLPRGLERTGPRLGVAEAARAVGRFVSVAGRLTSVRLSRMPGRGSVVRVRLQQDDASIDGLFFRQPWLAKQLSAGMDVELYGRVVDARGPALASPRIGTQERPLPAPGTLRPVYPQLAGFRPAFLSKLLTQVVERCADGLVEHVPAADLARMDLPALGSAVRDLHLPRDAARFERARRRLALEPALELQARLLTKAAGRREGRARPLEITDRARERLFAALPFELTAGQRTVLDELSGDVARTRPMRRLLQGDVGSGKTVLGWLACALAARAGAQAAFLAPTELLAEQHLAAVRDFARLAGLRCTLLTGSLRAAERRKRLTALAAGEVDLVFGTHALFSDDVRYADLALAVIDEQHRFGVAQRRALLAKGRDVHVLLMTATPIPRTLALTLYADLDVSTLRERPPGRRPVRTRCVRKDERGRLVEALRERLSRGERVYWVAPRIESTEQGRGVEELAERLAVGELGTYGVECVHGRLGAAERERRVARFRRGTSGVLVGTTVIEVGVDVPEASAIVVSEPERFGLAQLHQLRGRVGRRADQDAACYLIAPARRSARVELLVDEDDGFTLAEQDLRLRGMGDLGGLRQSGENREGWSGDEEEDLSLLLFAREVLERSPAARAFYAARDARRNQSTG